MASLSFSCEGETLMEYRLRQGRTSIGRADSCDVALPGDAISRTHCFIVSQGGAWELHDRSRHGTTVNGAPVERAELKDGDVVGIGPYQVRLRVEGRSQPPTAEAEPDRGHELLLGSDSGVQVERAYIVVVDGPDAGCRRALDAARVSVGGVGSVIGLTDPALRARHCWLRVARGRVMVEPGAGAAYLDSARVRAITPLYPDEEVRIGSTTFRVEHGVSAESPLANRFGELRSDSLVMKHLFGTLRRVSGHHYPVLVLGGSGTGKELVARGIHDHSTRAERRFVPINCGAIHENLFESELFGHEKGAFTGAEQRKDGAFHEADGGTLFLDEVGELPEAAQAKLLRVLETGEVRRVGGFEVRHPDVRIVAATNRDLSTDVAEGRFRADLFFRLAVLKVDLPPLRDRLDDLPLLCRVLCQRLHPEARVTPEALEVLAAHDWPGNVRELRNVLTRAYVLGGPRIEVTALSFHQLGAASSGRPTAAAQLEMAERDYIASVLRRHADNRSAAARELGIARSTLHYKIRKLGL